MNDILDYIGNGWSRFQEELKTYAAMPSISTDPGHKADLETCAEWLAEHCRGIVLDDVLLVL